jgi:hypothetical protein
MPIQASHFNCDRVGGVAFHVSWSLLTDLGAIKRAGVPILRLLYILNRYHHQVAVLDVDSATRDCGPA